MKTIAVEQFCVHYNIPASFIDSLGSFELIKIIRVENDNHLQVDEIRKVEKLMRLHYDLKVNFEALDVIENLTSQINSLQSEIHQLKNKIEFYKSYE